MDAGPDGEVITDTGAPDAGTDSGIDAGPPCVGPPGLYQDDRCAVISTGLRTFVPQYELWADDADKERYILLPAGQQIDTSDPDNWRFPQDTVIWKTFSLGGVRLETRILRKTGAGVGPDEWEMLTYAWNAAQTIVTEVSTARASVRENVLGTMHDIPSLMECRACHSGSLDAVNGFSAIQLNHAGAEFSLQDLIDEGRLTDPILVTDAVMPGNAVESDALGYLHANCGHCHRYTRYQVDTVCTAPPCCETPACFGTGLLQWVRVGTATVAATDVFTTAVGVRFNHVGLGDDLCRIEAGNADESGLLLRMEVRGDGGQMPPIATEFVHPEGVASVRDWIDAMPIGVTECP